MNRLGQQPAHGRSHDRNENAGPEPRHAHIESRSQGSDRCDQRHSDHSRSTATLLPVDAPGEAGRRIVDPLHRAKSGYIDFLRPSGIDERFLLPLHYTTSAPNSDWLRYSQQPYRAVVGKRESLQNTTLICRWGRWALQCCLRLTSFGLQGVRLHPHGQHSLAQRSSQKRNQILTAAECSPDSAAAMRGAIAVAVLVAAFLFTLAGVQR